MDGWRSCVVLDKKIKLCMCLIKIVQAETLCTCIGRQSDCSFLYCNLGRADVRSRLHPLRCHHPSVHQCMVHSKRVASGWVGLLVVRWRRIHTYMWLCRHPGPLTRNSLWFGSATRSWTEQRPNKARFASDADSCSTGSWKRSRLLCRSCFLDLLCRFCTLPFKNQATWREIPCGWRVQTKSWTEQRPSMALFASDADSCSTGSWKRSSSSDYNLELSSSPFWLASSWSCG